MQANQLVLGDLPYTPAPTSDNIVNSEVSNRVLIGEGSQIIDSVIRGPVIIGSNTVIRGSFVGPYSAVGSNVTIENSEIDASIVMNDCSIRNIPGRIDSSLLADNSEVVSANRVPDVHRFVLAENSYVQL